MDPITIAALGSLAGGAAGGILGANRASQSNKDAERVLDNMAQQFAGLDLPELSPVELEKFKELFVAPLQQGSQFGNIQLDPENLAAQKAALAQLGELSQGGLNLQDKAALQSLQDQVAQQDAGRQAAIMQNMAERGMGGGGQELAQRMLAQQAGSNRASQASTDVAAMAQKRALDAIMQRGALGGQMRQQEYGMAADKARAQDAINQFNIGQRTMEQQNRQNISNMDTQVAHQQAQQANQLAQQQFQNKLSKLSGQAGIAGSRANVTSGSGTTQAAQLGTIGSGLSQIAGMFGKK